MKHILFLQFVKKIVKTIQDDFRKAFETFIELAIESCKDIAAVC